MYIFCFSFVFKVLGAEPNAGPLIFWPKASQDCLDAFNIKAEAVDPVLLKSMFPNADGSNGKKKEIQSRIISSLFF